MKKISIFLNSEVSAFSISSSQKKRLEHVFSNAQLTVTDNRDDYINSLSDCDITITWQFKKEWYDNSNNLTHIFTPSAGRDWIEKPPKSIDITILHGKFHGKLMGESLLAMMLYFNRDLSSLEENSKNRIWDRDIQSRSKPIFGQTVLILGYGNIGREFAKMVRPFNMKIYGLQRKLASGVDSETGVEYVTEKDLVNLLPKIDHLISILPKNKSTDNFINYHYFELIKESAFFYNVGRGNCCKDSVILKAIENSEISGAGLDVFNNEPLSEESPLWNNKKILISPHSSCIFIDYLDRYFDEIIPVIKTLI